MTHNDFLKIAIQYAKLATENKKYPFGAIIVKEGQIVGHSNISVSEYDPTAHAEITAIRDACQRLQTTNLSGCILYSSCYPCSLCLGALKWAGIREMYYAMDQSDAEKIGFKNEIFMEEIVNLFESKITNKNFVTFMKDWYSQTIKK